MTNNSHHPEFLETPEVYDILMKFSILTNFHSAYTMTNLDDESYLNLQYLTICLNAQEQFMKIRERKNTFYAKEGVYGN